MLETNGICGDLIGACIHCFITTKETGLISITGSLLWINVGPSALLVGYSILTHVGFSKITQTDIFTSLLNISHETYGILTAISHS